jgi:peroxiredoxin
MVLARFIGEASRRCGGSSNLEQPLIAAIDQIAPISNMPQRLTVRPFIGSFSVRPIHLALPLFLFLALLVSSYAFAQAEETPLLTPVEGLPTAPDFDLTGPKGESYSLSQWRGQPIIVNFWATWCPPCRAEMPSMQRAWETLEGDGVQLIAINVGEEPGEIEAFLERVPVSFPLPMDTDMRVSQAYPMRGLPTTFVVDAEGRLAYKAQGEREWDDPALLDLVRSLRR